MPGMTRPVELLDLARWAREPDSTDELVLARCAGPTLDIGCGPGRMVLELNRRGVPALGIDVLPEAVRHVRRQGGMALQRSIFCPLPGEGRWSVALLLDGCVGIGGAPTRLLTRLRELIGPAGIAYVEHEPDEHTLELGSVRVRGIDGETGPPVPWAALGAKAFGNAVQASGLVIADSWTTAGRAFAAVRAGDPEGPS